MVKEKLIIYPFSVMTIPLVRFFLEYKEYYEILLISSPIGYGLQNKDVGYADNRKNIGIIIAEDLEYINWPVDTCTLVICEYLKNDQMNLKIEQIMKKAIELKKKIICIPELQEVMLSNIGKLCKSNNISFRYCPKEICTLNWKHNLYDSTSEKKFPFIICIGGLIDDTYCFEVFAYLYTKLKKEKIKVTAFANSTNCEFIGAHSIQKDFFENSFSNEDKIKNLRKSFLETCKKEHAEILLIQIPFALMPYNEIVTNGFGIYTYMISQIINPDIFICIVPYEMTEQSVLNQICSNLERKFDFVVNYIIVNNQLIDGVSTAYEENLVYLHQKENEINKFIKLYNPTPEIPVFNLHNHKELEKLVKNIIQDE